MAKEGEKIHFDIANSRIISYSTITDLEEQLTKRLQRMLNSRDKHLTTNNVVGDFNVNTSTN